MNFHILKKKFILKSYKKLLFFRIKDASDPKPGPKNWVPLDQKRNPFGHGTGPVRSGFDSIQPYALIYCIVENGGSGRDEAGLPAVPHRVAQHCPGPQPGPGRRKQGLFEPPPLPPSPPRLLRLSSRSPPDSCRLPP